MFATRTTACCFDCGIFHPHPLSIWSHGVPEEYATLVRVGPVQHFPVRSRLLALMLFAWKNSLAARAMPARSAHREPDGKLTCASTQTGNR